MTHLAEAKKRIEEDLQILEAMAAEMPRYLMYDGLFYPLPQMDYPRLTLGNYLMRQHRLLALADDMPEATAGRLARAVDQFQEAIDDHLVRVEEHANQELQTRVKQWDTYVDELTDNPDEHMAYYATHATDRTILQAIFDFMQPPYNADPRARQELQMLDFVLHGEWDDGPFVWPEVWQPSYPRQDYWWLYGRPALTEA